MRTMNRQIKPLLLLFSLLLGVFGMGQETSRDLTLTRVQSAPGLPVYTNSHALIVGVNKYPNLPKSVQLKYAVNDATGIRDTLIDFYGFPKENVQVLLDEKATMAGILAALDRLSNQGTVGADDRIVVYFSGHGQTARSADGNDRGFLIPFDAKVSLENPSDIASYDRTCVPMQEVWNRLDRSPAKHIAVIADACFSGHLTKSRGLWDEENPLSAYLTMKSRQAVSAGGKGQKTWETDEYKHGVFTYNLLTELRKRAKEKQRVFSMVDLFAAIQDPTVRMSKGRQIPQMSQFYTEGQMLFFAAGEKPVTDVVITDPKTPKVEKATLVVKSNPAGAVVTVDGEDLGEAPLTKVYELEKNKKVKVRLELDGYEPREKTVELRLKRETKVDEKLKKLKTPPKPKPARLTIVTSPAGATISVDGEEFGSSPVSKEIVIEGDKSVNIRVQLAGFYPLEQKADLKPGRETKLNLTLIREPELPKKATLEIETAPKGADLFVDGVSIGKSPQVYSQEILAPVSVSVRATMNGYQAMEQTATLDSQVPGKLTLTLRRNNATPPPLDLPLRLTKGAHLSYSGTMKSIQYSPDGSKVAITGSDDKISIFDTSSGRMLREINEPVTAFVRISSDWRQLLHIYLMMRGSEAVVTVMVEEIDKPGSAKVFSSSMGQIRTLNYAMASSGSLIVCGFGDGGAASMAVVDLTTGKSDSFSVGNSRLTGAWVSPDGRSIAVFRDALSVSQDTNVILLRGQTRDDHQQVRLMDSNVGQKIIYASSSDAIAVNAGRRTSGTAQTQRGMKIFETRDGRLRFSSTRHVAIGFMAGGTRLLAWSEAQGGSLELFDSVSGRSFGAQKFTRPVSSADGRQLMVAVPGGFDVYTVDPIK